MFDWIALVVSWICLFVWKNAVATNNIWRSQTLPSLTVINQNNHLGSVSLAVSLSISLSFYLLRSYIIKMKRFISFWKWCCCCCCVCHFVKYLFVYILRDLGTIVCLSHSMLSRGQFMCNEYFFVYNSFFFLSFCWVDWFWYLCVYFFCV